MKWSGVFVCCLLFVAVAASARDIDLDSEDVASIPRVSREAWAVYQRLAPRAVPVPCCNPCSRGCTCCYA
ncbi:hypothetical protein V1264_000740 [Littorina saxatilis]|uniref:Hepcidin n=1 Tax=Littorina saxatilis TaxID=31220 RepID=A0AAN9BZV0_9CAEN